jgi:DNA repair exonuclease SbcCD ATPase subunit
VGGAVDGLINSLSQSPLAEAQEFATALAPFLGPLKVLLAEADREASRQRFLAGLKTGLPLIKDDLIALLKKDSQLMAEVRFGLNDLQYERSLDRVNDAKRRFDRLSSNYAPTEEVRQMQSEITAALAKLPRDSDGKAAPLRSPAKSGSQEAMTAAVLAELESQRTQALNEIAGAMRVNDALLAYYDVLGAYVKLLNKMAASTGQLFQAAETGQKFVLPSDELLKAVITLRQSYLTYAEKK